MERHLRKFRKEYSHIHEWFVKAETELRKIENKQVSKNTREETEWIRVKLLLMFFFSYKKTKQTYLSFSFSDNTN